MPENGSYWRLRPPKSMRPGNARPYNSPWRQSQAKPGQLVDPPLPRLGGQGQREGTRARTEVAAATGARHQPPGPARPPWERGRRGRPAPPPDSRPRHASLPVPRPSPRGQGPRRGSGGGRSSPRPGCAVRGAPLFSLSSTRSPPSPKLRGGRRPLDRPGGEAEPAEGKERGWHGPPPPTPRPAGGRPAGRRDKPLCRGLTFNRSQRGSCSDTYETPTQKQVVYEWFSTRFPTNVRCVTGEGAAAFPAAPRVPGRRALRTGPRSRRAAGRAAPRPEGRGRRPAGGDGGGPAIRGQPRLPRRCRIVYRPSQTPHLALSPERVAPGRRAAGRLAPEARAPRGSPPRLTGLNSRIPLVRTSSKSAARRRPRRGAARNRGPGGAPGGGDRRPPGSPGAAATPAAAGAIHGKGPARVQSRRRRRPPGGPGPRGGTAPATGAPAAPGPGPPGPAAPPPAPRGGGRRGGEESGRRGGREPRGVGRGRARGGCPGRGGGGGASSSRGARPAPLRAPARPTQPLEPILIPKLRIRLADFPYLHCSNMPEAVHLGDLLRIWVRPGARFTPSPPDFPGPARAHRTPPEPRRFPRHGPLSRGEPIPGRPALHKEKRTLPGAPAGFSGIGCVTALDASRRPSPPLRIRGSEPDSLSIG
ncbi:LOW QUALITY PROTEIN: collagen alpha-1(I) chain-like [Cervus canadensis]|uniref:LOW QUALITY PROTEIN: collagen alpha-1(I) chain-like n=1 Tax=Cervus canadensis TaxID=1574408 RepID=UPI001C9E307D|nr:LOW QUALITY PROTEIN: collagen alpha-1(I) chain-like [Cervus canadensis]